MFNTKNWALQPCVLIFLSFNQKSCSLSFNYEFVESSASGKYIVVGVTKMQSMFSHDPAEICRLCDFKCWSV